MEKEKQFKPYVPAEKVTPEITVTSIIVGVILSVVFGAANAYLGLKVGMTVSASIPAAVIAMGVIRVILRRNSILESNIVQTIGSAGESLAAGAIFTLPALFIWASDPKYAGQISKPDILQITLIALVGGLLGVFFMVPLRNALIVKEHGILPYPEGTACAEVLLAGEQGGANASTVFAGMGIAAVFKFLADGIKVIAGQVSYTVKGIGATIGTQVYPALLSVGYICGPKISSYMFSGSLLRWCVLIPAIVLFGGSYMIDGTSIQTLIQTKGIADTAQSIWGSCIKYIGAGALAAGGIISLIKSLPTIVKTFSGALKSMTKSTAKSSLRTEQDLHFGIVLGAIAILTIAVWLIPAIPVSLLGALIIVLFGFFFATVSSRMVGLVGSSNNPVSGMAIATVLIAACILKFTGASGVSGMISAISIGSVICIVAAISGDTSQDLKTGYILGSTPKKQQMSELVGVVAAALAIGGTLYLLDKAYGFGSEELGAPQATLMKTVIEGVMENSLPWALIFIGVAIAVIIEVLGIPVLPFAIGVYLPIHINACIMVGGLIRLATDKMFKQKEKRDEATNKGILFCSGMIAGEGLMGILLAIFAIVGIAEGIDLSKGVSAIVSNIGGIAALAAMVALIMLFTTHKKRKK